MKRVKIADLKNGLSQYLAHVRGGGELVVLDRATPIARIVPYAAREPVRAGRDRDPYWSAERLADMERLGILSTPSEAPTAAWLKTLRAVALPPGSRSAVDVLLQARRESRR